MKADETFCLLLRIAFLVISGPISLFSLKILNFCYVYGTNKFQITYYEYILNIHKHNGSKLILGSELWTAKGSANDNWSIFSAASVFNYNEIYEPWVCLPSISRVGSSSSSCWSKGCWCKWQSALKQVVDFEFISALIRFTSSKWSETIFGCLRFIQTEFRISFTVNRSVKFFIQLTRKALN